MNVKTEVKEEEEEKLLCLLMNLLLTWTRMNMHDFPTYPSPALLFILTEPVKSIRHLAAHLNIHRGISLLIISKLKHCVYLKINILINSHSLLSADTEHYF